jgi:hypothetical protein
LTGQFEPTKVLMQMKKKAIRKIIIFLREKRQEFNSAVEEFHEFHSPSYGVNFDPTFSYDLDLLQEELSHIFAFEDKEKVISYYQRLIKQLKDDAFVSANEYYKPDDSINSYYDREAFLVEYYKEHPDDNHGEGELEWINICFEGFLLSYTQLINEVISTIEAKISEEIPNPKFTNRLKFKYGVTSNDVKTSIKKHTKFLNRKDSIQQVLMEDTEYARFTNELYNMIYNGMPADVVPLKENYLDSLQIWQAFSQIHKDIYPKGKRNHDFEEFLKNYFPKTFASKSVTSINSKFHNPYNH